MQTSRASVWVLLPLPAPPPNRKYCERSTLNRKLTA